MSDYDIVGGHAALLADIGRIEQSRLDRLGHIICRAVQTRSNANGKPLPTWDHIKNSPDFVEDKEYIENMAAVFGGMDLADKTAFIELMLGRKISK